MNLIVRVNTPRLRVLALLVLALLPASLARAANETWSLACPPPGIWKNASVYDPLRHRLIVSGGYLDLNQDVGCTETWALPLQGEPVWTRIATNAPGGGQGGIYDPLRDRMVVYDGTHVSVLPLSSPSSWSTLATAGSGPSGAPCVYDPAADRMLIAPAGGGVYSLSFTTPTPTWSLLATTGSGTGGYSATMILDPVRNRLIGCAGGTVNIGVNVWELPLNTLAWHQLSFTGTQPEPRVFASAIYDPNGDRMILFGGQPDYGLLNDSWALSLSGTPTWTPLASAQTPTGRYLHTAVYDPDGQQMVVFGGQTGGSVLNDTWTLPLTGPTQWSDFGGSGIAPAPRWSHTAVYDVVQNRMIVFGGYTGSFANDVWVLWLGGARHWEHLQPTGTPPSARYLHTAIWDGPGQRMIVFGGFDGAYQNDVWALSFEDSPHWVQLSTTGGPPVPRAKHAAAFDPATRRMLVFGGEDASANALGDFWSLDLSSLTWSQIVASGAPQARTWPTATWDDRHGRLLVFGGLSSSSQLLGDVRSYSDGSGWTNLTQLSTPKLFAHSAVIDPILDRLLVYAGDDGSGYPPTRCYAMDLEALGWQSLATLGAQRPLSTFRNFHTAIFDAVDDQMIMYGGTYSGVYFAAAGPWQLASDRVLAVPGASAAAVGLSLRAGPRPTQGDLRISFELPTAGATRLEVFGLDGRRVATVFAGTLQAGHHDLRWSPTGTSARRAGVLWLRLEHGSQSDTQRIVMLR